MHKNGVLALCTYNSVAVEVRFELALAPGVEGRRLGRVGGLREIAGDRGVRRAASGRSRGICRLGSSKELVASSAGLLSSLLGGGVSRGGQVLLQVIVRPVVKGPGGPAGCGLVSVLADKSTELVGLGLVRNRDTAGVEVGLQARLGPRVHGLVESLLGRDRSLVSSLGIVVAGLGSGSTVGRSSRGRGRGSVIEDLSTVLADKGTKLLGLGTLGNGNAVCVAELLELRLAPGVDELVGQSSIGLLGASSGTSLLLLSLEVGEARVAADRGDQLVTRGRLRGRDSVGVEPFLEVRLGPGVVQPVARVVGGLANLLGNGVVVLADLGEESVALAGLGNWRRSAYASY